jgi:hypothetical protein
MDTESNAVACEALADFQNRNSTREYEDVFKSFRTESITKYRLIFGITRCCPLQSFPLPSLCNGSSLSAIAGSTVGTEFFESRVGRPAIIPEFQ